MFAIDTILCFSDAHQISDSFENGKMSSCRCYDMYGHILRRNYSIETGIVSNSETEVSGAKSTGEEGGGCLR